MKSLSCMLVLMLLVAGPVWGTPVQEGEEEIRKAVTQSLTQILDLWRDGRYEELYERTLAGGGQSKEAFIGRLSSATYRPACCWEKLQDVRVIVKGKSQTVVRAKIGLEGGSGTSATTRDLKMTMEEGSWRIGRSDLLALAGSAGSKSATGRKKTGYNR